VAAPKPSQQFYQIGTVARLTGLSTHNIRMWEKRYGVVAPDRSHSRNRLYSQHDLERLQLIKELVDCGHTISRLAPLNESELQGILAQQSQRAHSVLPEYRCTKVVVISDFLSTTDIAPIALGSHIEVQLINHAEANQCLEQSSVGKQQIKDDSTTVFIIDQPTLHRDDAESWLQILRLRRCPLGIMVYQYSDKVTLKAFTSRISRAVKGPLTLDLLERELLVIDTNGQQLRPLQPGESVPQRFSYAQLLRFAQMTTNNHCECPKHLATLLIDMVNFEQYSQECGSRSQQDKEMHEYLHLLAGSVRSQLEDALIKLAEMERIAIDD